MATKYIGNSVTVDLSKSRAVRSWGKGDCRVELWADKGNRHVWCETNGGPVNDREGLISLLIECGLDLREAEAVADGDVDAAL